MIFFFAINCRVLIISYLLNRKTVFINESNNCSQTFFLGKFDKFYLTCTDISVHKIDKFLEACFEFFTYPLSSD